MITFTDSNGNQEQHKTVRRLDLENGVIDIGNFFTSLPISPPYYRKKHPTGFSIKVKVNKDIVIFDIADDYGKPYTLTVTGEEIENPIIKAAIAKATASGSQLSQ